MNTSQKSFLSDVLNVDRIPIGKLAYFRGRLTNRIHALVLEEFDLLSKADKINKAQLAKRIGREPAQVTRWLGSPGNWTIETFSDLLLAMGYEPTISVRNLAGAAKPAVDQSNIIVMNFSNATALPVTRSPQLPEMTSTSLKEPPVVSGIDREQNFANG